MLLIIGFVFAKDKDIIKVNNIDDVNKITKGAINISLEGRGRVSQPKRHYYIFEIAISSSKSSLLYVARPNPYSIVSVAQIYLSKDSS